MGRAPRVAARGGRDVNERDLIKKHGLPPIDGPVLETRYKMGTGDWHIRTSDGWFYCRTQDVDPKNRRWVPSVYGPTD